MLLTHPYSAVLYGYEPQPHWSVSGLHLCCLVLAQEPEDSEGRVVDDEIDWTNFTFQHGFRQVRPRGADLLDASQYPLAASQRGSLGDLAQGLPQGLDEEDSAVKDEPGSSELGFKTEGAAPAPEPAPEVRLKVLLRPEIPLQAPGYCLAIFGGTGGRTNVGFLQLRVSFSLFRVANSAVRHI